MKLKTTLLALVTVALLCSALAFVAVANSDLEISATTVTASAGDTVTVTLNIDQNPGIYYLGLYLDYDTSALTLDSVKNESNLTFMSGLQQIWYCNGVDNSTYTGKLATLTFVVNENAVGGDYEIGILTDWAECYDVDENNVAITFNKGAVKICTHANTVSETIVEPTCTEAGECAVTCADCGISLGNEVVEALGHEEGEWVVTTEPTCTEAGEQSKYCTRCGELLHSESIDATGHTPGEWEVSVEATCLAAGLNVKKCTVCGEVVESYELPMVDHNYGELGLCTVCQTGSPVYISAEAVQGTYGDIVTVELNLDRNAGMYYLSVMIEYDTDALELVSVENSSSFSYMAGFMHIWYANGSDNITETGSLATLTFKIKDTAAAETTYPVTLTVFECYNIDEESVIVCTGEGSVYVYDFVYGDVNDDGVINGQDATRLLRYLASYNPFTGESTTTIGKGADVNGDGKINGADVSRLFRYLANFNPTTGESTVVLGPTK